MQYFFSIWAIYMKVDYSFCSTGALGHVFLVVTNHQPDLPVDLETPAAHGNPAELNTLDLTCTTMS